MPRKRGADSPHAREIGVAMRQGECRNSGSNRRTVMTGMFRTVWSMTGPVFIPEGAGLEFYYYRSKALTVDFGQKRIAHHNFANYSHSTDANLHRWFDALRALDLIPDSTWHWRSWTTKSPMYVSPGSREARFNAFRERAPWCQKEHDFWWFHWPLFDEAKGDQYWESERDLANDQQWRYFTYEWGSDGAWVRRFIDAKAEERFQAREHRRERQHRRTVAASSILEPAAPEDLAHADLP